MGTPMTRVPAIAAAIALRAALGLAETITERDDNAAILAGTWTRSTSVLLYYGDAYSVAQGGGSVDSATFQSSPLDPNGGTWCVDARWTAAPNRALAARYRIYDGTVATGSLVATVVRDQRQSGGAWQRLQCVVLTNPISQVVLDDVGTPAGNFVVADAVRWVKENFGRTDLVDEPGIDWAGQSSRDIATLTQCPTYTNLTSDSITLPPSEPSSHFILVSASGQTAFTNSLLTGLGGPPFVEIVIDDASGGTTRDTHQVRLAAADDLQAVANQNRKSFALQEVYAVTGTGSRTYYLKACRGLAVLPPGLVSPAGTLYWNDFVLLYIPTMR